VDGRKNNGGHSTKGKAGRKPKADEIKLIEQMDAIAAPELAWQALWSKCQDGDVQAVKTWLGYRYGMPKQAVDNTVTVKEFPVPIIEVPNE
jgi:hypothetical protein